MSGIRRQLSASALLGQHDKIYMWGGVELIDATVLGQVDSFIGDYRFYCGGGG